LPTIPSRCRWLWSAVEVDRRKSQERRDAEAKLDEALALPRLRTGPIELEHEQTGDELGSTLGEGVRSRSEDDVLPDATDSLFRDEIFDDASPGYDGGAERPREGLMRGGGAICRRAPPPSARRRLQRRGGADQPERAGPATTPPARPWYLA